MPDQSPPTTSNFTRDLTLRPAHADHVSRAINRFDGHLRHAATTAKAGSSPVGFVPPVEFVYGAGAAQRTALSMILLDVLVQEDRVGLVAGLEVEELALADLPAQSHARGILPAVAQRVHALEDHGLGFGHRVRLAVTLVVGDRKSLTPSAIGCFGSLTVTFKVVESPT